MNCPHPKQQAADGLQRCAAAPLCGVFLEHILIMEESDRERKLCGIWTSSPRCSRLQPPDLPGTWTTKCNTNSNEWISADSLAGVIHETTMIPPSVVFSF